MISDRYQINLILYTNMRPGIEQLFMFYISFYFGWVGGWGEVEENQGFFVNDICIISTLHDNFLSIDN